MLDLTSFLDRNDPGKPACLAIPAASGGVILVSYHQGARSRDELDQLAIQAIDQGQEILDALVVCSDGVFSYGEAP